MFLLRPTRKPANRPINHTSTELCLADLKSLILTTNRRKKFLKLRHNFKDRMRDSNKFFDEEQHAMRLARRLQEQNEYYSILESEKGSIAES